MSNQLKYRADIDGLRTVAIIAVIVFHLERAWLPGGFLGVDVFFVISGFLITSIITRDLKKESFSYVSFLKRRFFRLFPALLVVCSVTLLLGSLILPNPERSSLSLQVVAAILSFSNVLMYKTTGGYWDSSSENIALLHTWSLSLEEQFYLFFPLLLLVIYKVKPKYLFTSIVCLCVLSFCICLYYTSVNNKASFYMLPSRMWELLLGSILALLGQKKSLCDKEIVIAPYMQFLGIILILCSYAFIENSRTFPGVWPLLPCLGTIMLLRYGEYKGLVNKLLTLKPSVGIGKISYSLYLWHWPVIVFAYYLNVQPMIIVMLGVMVVLSTITYFKIEMPFRFHRGKSQQISMGFFAVVLLSSFIHLTLTDRSVGLEKLGDFDSEQSFSRGWAYEATSMLEKGEDGVLWKHNNSSQINICVIGSSHARVLCEPIKSWAEAKKLNFISMCTSNNGVTTCQSLGYSSDGSEINQNRIASVSKLKPEVIIIAGMWSNELSKDGALMKLKSVISECAKSSSMVLVVEQVPLVVLPEKYQGSLRKYIVSCFFSKVNLMLNSDCKVIKANNELRLAINDLSLPNVHLIETHRDFLNPTGTVKVQKNNKFLYSDYHHVNHIGAEYVFKKLNKFLYYFLN